MPHPGKKKDDPYLTLPYLETWQPVQGRRWALEFVRSGPNGEDDEEGFQKEFEKRHPFNFIGPAASWRPASLDDYIRFDSRGTRQDIDWELAHIPKTEEEREAVKKAALQERRELRLAALHKRGLTPLADLAAVPKEEESESAPSERPKTIGERLEV